MKLKRVFFIVLTFLIVVVGCEKVPSQPTKTVQSTVKSNTTEPSTNQSTLTSKSKEKTNKTEKTEWLQVYYVPRDDYLFIKLNDIFKQKPTVVTTPQLINTFISNNVVDPKEKKDLYIRSISNQGRYIYIRTSGGNGPVFYYDLLNRKKMNKADLKGKDLNLQLYGDSSKKQIYLEDIASHTFKQLNFDSKFPYYDAWVSQAFSPDHSQIAFGLYNQGKDYVMTYDFKQNKIIHKIYLGEDHTDRIMNHISQFQSNGNVFFNYLLDGYVYNNVTNQLTKLGKYIFYPMETQDGRYLIYSKPTVDPSEAQQLTDLPDYGETGLFIKDMKTGKILNLTKELNIKNMKSGEFAPTQIIESTIDYSKDVEINKN